MTLKMKYQNLLHRLEMNTLEWVGLDIGSFSVKMVQGRWFHKQFTATGACLVELGETETSEEHKQGEIPPAIRNCLQKASMKTPAAVCAHSGPEVLTRHFQFPPLPEEALAQAIHLEAQQMSPFDLNQSIVDFQAIGSARRSQEGHQGFMVVAMRDAIQRKIEWVKAAGGKVLLMDVEGLAALNCLQACLPEPPAGAIALINIGNRFTTVSILGEDGIPFIRDLTYAGKNICTTIQQQTGLAGQEIRNALFAAEDSAVLPDEIQAALKNASRRNIADINETLRYYLTQHSTSELTGIYLTGGWALSRPFVDLLAGALPMDVEVFNPFQTLPIKAPPAQEALMKTSGPALTVAAGLAMRTIS